MSSMQRQAANTGSDTDPRSANIDERKRKRKRMLSNRESARRSRMRKQKQMVDMDNLASQLQKEIDELRQGMSVVTQRYVEPESDNNALRARVLELTERLRSLNSVLEIAEAVSGLSVEIPEIPGLLLETWQLPCSVQPVMASADVFQY